MNCIFCKILNKEIPNYTVYEDENVLAFLDIFPCAKGHTVVIPKKHFENLWDMNVENFQAVAAGLRAATGRVQARLKPDGMNIGINNGEVAGQAVPHVHWHIIPRYAGDGGGNMHSIIKNSGDQTPAELSELFK
ncbi:MAG: HIT family protein [Candidatus Magasanikbacteria bacterium]|nr:HIT family protein [Candidatus Magasanikbacteria bacterium]